MNFHKKTRVISGAPEFCFKCFTSASSDSHILSIFSGLITYQQWQNHFSLYINGVRVYLNNRCGSFNLHFFLNMLGSIIVYYNQCDIHHEGDREDLILTIACLYFIKFIYCFCLFWETLIKLKLKDFMLA